MPPFTLLVSSNLSESGAFSHHVFVKSSHKEVQLAEVGPRFELKRKSIPVMDVPYDAQRPSSFSI